ncbi:MAG: hypothetical protein AAGD25_08435 [Cyanobacteria bacterium P01_F01_bin.150]
MLKKRFKLEKLKIHIYDDVKRMGMPLDTFEAMFNPESYSLNHSMVYDSSKPLCSSGTEQQYTYHVPEDLTLDLYLDSTGVASVGSRDVQKEVERFLKLTMHMNGKIHQPNFLKIEWGDLIFNCRLQSVEVNYSLFDRSGRPIRAKLHTSFVKELADVKRPPTENKSSPDLTHVRTVKAGDNLPLMSHKIYGDPSYYIQLARANNLNNFRKLKVGKSISLPPTAK